MYSDYPVSPDAVSEVSILTSNYEPQFGSTGSAVVNATTKSGTSQFHGSAYEFLRNSALNARQFGVPKKTKNIENDFGVTIGGPVKIPNVAWTGTRKTFFFINAGRYYVRGGTVAPILSIPSAKQRIGDFSDWTDARGNLIPVYDSATTRRNPNYNSSLPTSAQNLPFLRDQFMGCDGKSPNVICASDSRLRNSLANGWLKYLPTPTFQTPLNNYVAPLAYSNSGGAPLNYRMAYDGKIDHYIREKDRISVVLHYHAPIYSKLSYLPPQLANERFIDQGGAVGPWANRLNWDHTFSPTFLTNVNVGYMNMRGRDSCVNQDYVKDLPKISGVPSNKISSQLTFENFQTFGCTYDNYSDRPTLILNNLTTWVRGRHTLKFGGEYRHLELNSVNYRNTAGSFNFTALSTGLLGINSGNSIASFLLGQVGNANAAFLTVNSTRARGRAASLFAGDTWRAKTNLSMNYGVRWDMDQPYLEVEDKLSFFDISGPNPGAGNRPGRLAFAGNGYGPASFGKRYPEALFLGAFAPRIGIAYTPNQRSVVRAGYGIFFAKQFTPGWAAGVSTAGFNLTPSFGSADGGMTAAFNLADGFPSNFNKPPFINSSYLNGQNAPLYRPSDANRLPYTQQWNLTIEHKFGGNLNVSAAYVGNKGTRLGSTVAPLNALDPKYLSMGARLFDQFTVGQTSVNGVPLPYAGWVEQMRACAPSVAQALLPYPQYCGPIRGLNENAGNSTYHSAQLKAEKRVSQSLWLLASYTSAKLLTDVDTVYQGGGILVGGGHGVISPYERKRNKALAMDDIPQTLSAAAMYQLPFGKGKRFLNHRGVLNKVVGGWTVTSIVRAQSGTPLFFRSSQCTVPSQFIAACIPAVLAGANPLAQDRNSFEPSKPLFNVSAFEPASSFVSYYGKGARVSNIRAPGYRNADLGIAKDTKIAERVNVQFRGEFFNVMNLHNFVSNQSWWAAQAFDTNVASPRFGLWNGAVSPPRNIQFGMKLQF
ncbi:MAG: TonB-dependent receptor [Acidobacteria bacterium]|nr:TonB-dependent receptor [Acidobacteriota bacterium]